MSLCKIIKGNMVLTILFFWLFIMGITSSVKADSKLNKDIKALLEVDEDAIAILKDKSGRYFQIQYQVSLKSGEAYSAYEIQNVKGGKITLLGGGSYDGTDGTCGQGYRKEMLNLLKAVIPPIKLSIRDLNDDKYFDIFAEFVEEDCKTGEKITITNIFYATDNGFILEEGEK